ncbi:MAG: cobalamin B12-binding domain-containing protein [Anaerolineales bacterium]|nr:cobalamin B12-binding domain-containing protein [Anaerolineales bacterium]
MLRQHGYTVEIAPFSTADEMDAVVQRARVAQPRLVGLSIIFQYRAPEFLALAEELRRVLPHTHITTGGHSCAKRVAAISSSRIRIGTFEMP